MASSANSTIREFGVALGIALLVAVFLGNGGELSPTGYDGAIGPALLTGAAAVASPWSRRSSPRAGSPGLTQLTPSRTRVRRPPRGPASCPRIGPG